MYQILSAKTKDLTEDALRERVAEVYPEWELEALEEKNDTWMVRLQKKADFPFDKKDKADDAEDTADEAKDTADEADDKADEAEDKADDAKDEDGDSDVDASDGIDEGEAKDLVGELTALQDQLNSLVTELGGKAQEVADDAAAKDEKIKDIADSVAEVAPPGLDGPAGLTDETLGDAPAMPGGPGMGGPGRGAPKPPAVPGRKRPPAGVRAPGGPSVFTNRKTEVVTHPGRDAKGGRISIVAAARELEAQTEFKNYEVISMTTNPDGTFSAKLRAK
jgi:hypothetical protein